MEHLCIFLFLLHCLRVAGSTPLFEESFKIVDTNGKTSDHFGSWNSVAVTSTHMIVGAWQDDEKGISNIGSVSVYKRSSKGIDPIGTKIIPIDGKQNDYFGYSVAMNRDFIIVGAEGHDQVGAVYIYLTDENYTFHSKLIPDENSVRGDKFGSSIAINDDNTLLVGNYNKNGGQGTAYVYQLQNDGWAISQTLMPNDLMGNDWFGWGLSIAGNNIAVAAHGQKERSGCIYVYMKDDDSMWKLKQKLAPVQNKNSYFGYSLNLGENILIAGALGVEKSYIFGIDGNTWSLKETLSASDPKKGNHFGSTVAIQGKKLAIAARNFGFGNVRSVGQVYVFKYNEKLQKWQEHTKLKPSDGAKADFFGISIAICGNNVYCTSANNAIGYARGAVYVFKDEN